MRRAELQDVKETAKLLGKLTQSFGESLSALMDRRGITVERLAEASYLSAKTIQRMRNDDDHIWKIEQVMAVCIGLKLPLYISDLLLKKAGLIFKSGEKHLIYQHLLAMHYNKPISEFNEYLNVAGFPPLTNNE
jgi:transcriptional regulator with XRE-family HTH domain